MVNLRERKRLETWQRISDQATRLFERHGFENVTLAQVAEAADVSLKTVVNYFGAKEDLFFDAEPKILEALVSALRERGGSSATTAVRGLLLDSPIITGPWPWHEVQDDLWESMRIWSECERRSPTLRSRRAAILQSWLEPLAFASGSAAWAAMLVGVLVARHQIVQHGLARQESPPEVGQQVVATVGEALDVLEQGFAGT